MTENLAAAFAIGALIAAPLGYVLADKVGHKLRRRYLIVDRRTGQVVRRFYRFGSAADYSQRRYVPGASTLELEKR